MSESPPHYDHWRRLAADLGLDVGPEPEQPADAIPEPSHPPFEPAAEAEPARGRRRRPEPEEDLPPEMPAERLESAEVEESPRGRRGRQVEDGGLFEAEPSEAEIEGSDVEGAAVPEPDSAPESADESLEDGIDEKTGKRRRRRRSRRKKTVDGPAGESGIGAESAEDRPAVEPAGADDDEEEPTAEVVRNWNVPSWDELIDSLHRPER